MIKTDKAIYRVRTQEEYYWLIDRLDEAGCKWTDGRSLIDYDEEWDSAMSDSHIWVGNKAISYSYPEFFYDYYKDNLDYEIIEVSEVMEDEEETEAQDKTEEETDTQNKLEAIHKQVTNQIEDLRKQGKEPKAIEYTIKVCFE